MSRSEHSPTFGLWETIEGSLWRHEDEVAIRWREEVWTYGDVLDGVADRVESLRAAGLEAGDRVLLIHGNGPGFVTAELALLALGAVKVPVSPMLSAAEVAVIADRVEPAAAVIDVGGTRNAEHLVGLVRFTSDHERPPAQARKRVSLSRHDGRDLDSPCVIYFSGGTTGQPKGIVHHERGLLANLWAHVVETGIDQSDRLLLATPQVHAAGLFCQTALARGAQVRLTDGFDTTAFLETVDADRTTCTFLVPTMIHRLVAHASASEWKNRTIRTIQYGAAPISADLLGRAGSVFGPVFQQLYAQTECPNFVTALTKADHVLAQDDPRLLASAGRATMMADVAVLDDAGEHLPPGAVGEVSVRSPYVMSGYWRDPQGYADRFSGPWLRTGDLGSLDESGYLRLVDRKNDMIVTGGMNVFSVEVENVLTSLPDVAEAVVVGRPDAEWGESVHAFVVLSEDVTREGAPERLMAQSRDLLATYKRPKSIEVRRTLPVTRFGKPDKKVLRAELWAGHERSIG